MKERQRWQPEEDALLRAYVKQYGAKEWNMVAQRMGKPLDRDAKSCLERWKNYLKPGIKKGSLTEEEQNLVISLQAKYGNKWKKIAAEVPGRTAKRLGKWWEVFKEKQLKEKRKERPDFGSETGGISAENGGPAGKYDHILETFAEKYVQPKLCKEGSSAGNHIPGRLITVPPPPTPSLISDAASFLVAAMPDPRLALSETPPLLSLGAPASSKPDVMAAISSSVSSLPPWMSNNPHPSFPSDKDFFKQHPSASAPPSCSVSLSLSPPASEQPILSNGSASPDLLLKWVHKENAINGVAAQPFSSLALFCKELEEGRQNWFQHKKEATWRLSRLEQQLESEKARKRREKIDEIEAKIRCLRDEEMAYLDKLDIDCREQLISIQRDAELKEAKLMEQWSNKHLKLSKFLEQLGLQHHCLDSLKNFTSKDLH